MASTTKIMTALLTLEEAAIENRQVKITREMVMVEGSSMGLREGDVLTLRDLAVGMLTVSGNDAANSAAIAVAGSREAFVETMNQRAQALGMTDTHFDTPSGLDGDTHYSTALDMAKLGAAAMSNPEFAAIAGSKSMKVNFLSPEKTVAYQNHNKLLSLYEGCTGVKTGFTKKAGRCLVSSAEKDGVRLVAVTLDAPDDWNDHAALLDYGFSKMTSLTFDESGYSCLLPVAGAGEITVCGSSEPVTAALPVFSGRSRPAKGFAAPVSVCTGQKRGAGGPGAILSWRKNRGGNSPFCGGNRGFCPKESPVGGNRCLHFLA